MTATPSKSQNEPHIQSEKNNYSTLRKLVESLPCHGTVGFEMETSFWSLRLCQKWQDNIINIAKLSYLFIKDSAEYEKSVNLGMSWAALLNYKNPIIECVTPPSKAGLHISLGRWDENDKNKPKSLIYGKKVSFKITNIKKFESFRELPQNLPGQYTTNDGLRFYPTLWILADVEFIDFEINTKYPPHISLASVAVQLHVDKVQELQSKLSNIIIMDKKNNDTDEEQKENETKL